MLNRLASLAMSTSLLKAMPGPFISKDIHLVFSMNHVKAHMVLKIEGLLFLVCVCVRLCVSVQQTLALTITIELLDLKL